MKGDLMNRDVRSLTKEKLGRRVLRTVATLAILSVVAISTPQAGPAPPLTFSIVDPVADQRGTIDVTGMKITWTPNGKYAIELTADPANPFTGQFRININVYNPSSTSSAKVFRHVCSQCQKFGNMNKSDFDLGSATTTTLTLSGGDPELKLWKAGDQVATNSYAGLGNPPGSSLFRSSVNTQPLPGTFLTNEDMIGADDQTWDGVSTWDGSSGLATIVVGP